MCSEMRKLAINRQIIHLKLIHEYDIGAIHIAFMAIILIKVIVIIFKRFSLISPLYIHICKAKIYPELQNSMSIVSQLY